MLDGLGFVILNHKVTPLIGGAGRSGSTDLALAVFAYSDLLCVFTKRAIDSRSEPPPIPRGNCENSVARKRSSCFEYEFIFRAEK
jgi:hypothetical protein